LIETASLLAFHRSTADRAPITPCFGLTQALALLLQRQEILKCHSGRDPPDESEPLWRTIYDPIAWQYVGAWSHIESFESAVRQRLLELATSDNTTADKLALWQTLASAEAEGYLAHLLRRHGFDVRWAVDAADSGASWSDGLSLARMRYVVWASVREGAAAFLRSRGDPDEARSAIAAELRRRSRWLDGRLDLGQSFLPAPNARHSVLVTTFLEDIAPLGQSYWLIQPSIAALQNLAPRRGKRR
jgi:hypothetical protein